MYLSQYSLFFLDILIDKVKRQLGFKLKKKNYVSI